MLHRTSNEDYKSLRGLTNRRHMCHLFVWNDSCVQVEQLHWLVGRPDQSQRAVLLPDGANRVPSLKMEGTASHHVQLRPSRLKPVRLHVAACSLQSKGRPKVT